MFRRARSKPPEPPPMCRMSSARPIAADARVRLESEIKALGPWFHNYEIAQDVWTNPGGDGPGAGYPANRWRYVEPWFQDLAGKDCLDVACSSGFFSLKARELGASSVFGVDLGEQSRALDQARYAAGVLGMDVKFDALSAYDLPRLNRQFDTVFFMGLFYHLRHPLLALEAARAACRGKLIFQTITTLKNPRGRKLDPQMTRNASTPVTLDDGLPALRFVEGSLDGDTSCWFVPNVEAVLGMLRSCGFSPEETIFPTDHEIIVRCSVI